MRHPHALRIADHLASSPRADRRAERIARGARPTRGPNGRRGGLSASGPDTIRSSTIRRSPRGNGRSGPRAPPAESGALETPPEAAFDRLVKLAAVLMDVPHVTMNLVDDRRTWAKAAVGIPHGYEVDRSEEPFCAATIQRPLGVTVIEDTHASERTRENAMTRPGVRFYAGAPLVTGDGHAIRTLCVADTRPRQPSEPQLEGLRTLAAAIAAHLELRRLAAQDALTGLANRRVFDNTLARAIAHAEAAGTEVGVILVDVDRFKAYNDSRGHVAGDQLLRELARRWKALAGGMTLLARYGGEEFAVVAEGPDPGRAPCARGGRHRGHARRPDVLGRRRAVAARRIR